jgi:hypothetical protein
LNNKAAANSTDIHLELVERTAAGEDLKERSSRDRLSTGRGIDKQQTCFEALCLRTFYNSALRLGRAFSSN